LLTPYKSENSARREITVQQNLVKRGKVLLKNYHKLLHASKGVSVLGTVMNFTDYPHPN
jgi:hypothetical protein